MSRVHVPDHQWQKQKRKQRFKNRKRDRNKTEFKHDKPLNKEDEYGFDDLDDHIIREIERVSR